ncbi:MAG: hypothetical protein DHS20C11_20050 [Lysobacteraceae bacterium]|nr:MAG: hypothetical protein DHS20C11_20050 [Xanthomonadaceae bacterium]
MNTKRYVMASLAAGAWILVYGFVVNAMLLAEFWETNTPAELMRAEADQIMWAIIVSCFSQAFALGFIFTRGYESKGMAEGFRFGLLVAWFIASVYLLMYAIQPLPMIGLVVSSIADGIMYIGAGIVLALIYKE